MDKQAKPLDPDWKKKLADYMRSIGVIGENQGGKITLNLNCGGITSADMVQTLK